MADTFPASIPPDRITKLDREYNTEIVDFETENEQRFSSMHLGKKKYAFDWKAMTVATELATLITFFEGQLGRGKAWNITDTRLGGTVSMRFDNDKLSIKYINAKFADVSIEVKVC